MEVGQQIMEVGQQIIEDRQQIIEDRQHGCSHAIPQGKLLQLAQACQTLKNKKETSTHKAHEPGT